MLYEICNSVVIAIEIPVFHVVTSPGDIDLRVALVHLLRISARTKITITFKLVFALPRVRNLMAILKGTYFINALVFPFDTVDGTVFYIDLQVNYLCNVSVQFNVNFSASDAVGDCIYRNISVCFENVK